MYSKPPDPAAFTVGSEMILKEPKARLCVFLYAIQIVPPASSRAHRVNHGVALENQPYGDPEGCKIIGDTAMVRQYRRTLSGRKL